MFSLPRFQIPVKLCTKHAADYSSNDECLESVYAVPTFSFRTNKKPYRANVLSLTRKSCLRETLGVCTRPSVQYGDEVWILIPSQGLQRNVQEHAFLPACSILCISGPMICVFRNILYQAKLLYLACELEKLALRFTWCISDFFSPASQRYSAAIF